ncbi:MAG TPA: YdeI/OmpD-associated family protein [candidate division Zixibacteria bacterium]|nr:DUF1905 domain-containing protein [candidate division Zixibacteria bacterium]MDD4918826.1 YdeI/OmpD-associated family protein [candidate division Zixibacteria bacterium]MDM7973631.1 YdeI/OmpD-associated family protein [candidate division Zixibacteria bacterium]HOD66499.1 YdeI/OmpD-associated family protein [candidate division Zixibacteria bacterium]HOZ06959.1 YdeI/OmpD-associated family protein [candidate division Zixibacteria bacterium]
MKPVTCRAELVQDDATSGCGITLPFDPKAQFGKVRAPVVATINRYSFRTTVFSMGGCYWIPVNKSNRDAAGIAPGDRFKLRIALDTEPRAVTPPADLKEALAGDPTAKTVWDKLSYTHRREYVEWIAQAKKPETRARRLQKTLERLKEPR